MEQRPSLSELLAVFFSKEAPTDEAYTLIKRVEISSYIVDGQFILSTPEALRLYGRTEREMAETWQSLTQPLSEYRQSRALCMARHNSHDIPTAYVTRLLLPTGEVRHVIKRTRELSIDGVAHWLTRITLASEEPDLVDSGSIQLPSNVDQYRDFGGQYCLAEIYDSLGIDGKLLHSSHSMPMIGYSTSSDKGKGAVVLLAKNGTPLTFGQPVNTQPNGQVVYECQSCGWIWPPRKRKPSDAEALPIRCGNPDERCYDWQGSIVEATP